MAANRVGKTQCAAAEMACHLTGQYPSWWRGRRFKKGVKAWAAGESWEATRDVLQAGLLGPETAHGTGWIPAHRIREVRRRQASVSEVVEMIHVEHVSGTLSTVQFKTYEQERKKWQGVKLDIVHLDEEPPEEIYTEALTRTFDAQGLVYLTFTPLLGASAVVRNFLENNAAGLWLKNVTWDDAPHLTKEAKQQLWDSLPPHERETRAKGQPMLGTGAVFPISEDAIGCDPFPIPPHFYRINGVDFGIDHPAAGAFLAWDKDGDTIYVYDCYKRSGETPIYHAAALAKHGSWIPCAWPVDGLQRDKGSGIALKDMYRDHGATMMREAAHYPDERGRAREPGLIEMYEYMRTSRFKVFRNLNQWFEEKRLFHRKDGQVVAEHDDIMSATRYAFMMRRYAITRPAGKPHVGPPRRPIVGWQARHGSA